MEYSDLKELKEEEIRTTTQEEKKEHSDLLKENQPEEIEKSGEDSLTVDEKEQAEKFLNAMKNHTSLAKAEKAAGGEVLGEFVPASRGKKGWVQRKVDSVRLSWQRFRKDNPTISLYSMRIAERLDELEAQEAARKQEINEQPKEGGLSEVIAQALEWRLAWSMMDLRYFWHHTEEMRTMFKNADRIKLAMEYKDEAFQKLPGPQQEVLAAIVNAVHILKASMEMKLMENGVEMYGRQGQKLYERSRPVKITQKRCRMMFDQAMRELRYKERKANLTPAEHTVEIEKDLQEQYQEEMTDLNALLEKNQLPLPEPNDQSAVNAPVALLRLIRGDSNEDSLALYRDIRHFVKLSDPDSEVTEEEKQACVVALESVFREILSWDLNDFAFRSESDLTAPGFLKKRQKLLLARELAPAFDAYKKIFESDNDRLYASFGEDIFQEVAARLEIYQDLYTRYSEAVASYIGNDRSFNLPGDDFTEYVEEKRKKYDLRPLSEENPLIDYGQLLEEQESQKSNEEYYAFIRKKVYQRLNSAGPEKVTELMLEMIHFSAYFPSYTTYDLKKVKKFQDAITDTLTDYENEHLGLDLFRSFNEIRNGQMKTLLSDMNKLLQEDIPEAIAPPLSRKKGEKDRDFDYRKTLQKIQYVSLRLRDSKVGRDSEKVSLLEQDLTMVAFATGRVEENKVQRSFEDAEHIITPVYMGWLEENIKDEQDRAFFTQVLNNMSNKLAFDLLDQTAVTEYKDRFDKETGKEMTKFMYSLFL